MWAARGRCLTIDRKIRFDEQNDEFVCFPGWWSLKLIKNQNWRKNDVYVCSSGWRQRGFTSKNIILYVIVILYYSIIVSNHIVLYY